MSAKSSSPGVIPTYKHNHSYPDYMTLYSWETDYFSYDFWQGWFHQNWIISVYLSVAYVILIFSIKFWMRNRPPMKLRQPLILWNVGLAIFSGVGFSRTYQELGHILLHEKNGVHESVCSIDKMNIGIVFWCLLMAFSKSVELGDTIFIVLRKQPLIFLHWYHHITVMMYTWFTYVDHDAGHRWFLPINLGIHAFMYSYYAIRAMGIKVPKNLAMLITSSQLLQMFVGIWVNGYAFYAKQMGWECQTPTFNVIICLLMYLSYAVLFANFFIQTYVKRREGKKKET